MNFNGTIISEDATINKEPFYTVMLFLKQLKIINKILFPKIIILG
jgi:hypothetical protein